MDMLLILLLVQGVLGGIDNFWHHEVTERLPSKPSARNELALHAAREAIYAVIFLGFAWSEWHGLWAWAFAGLLVLEIGITLADFIIEDRTRKLPPFERVLHTILAIIFGALLITFWPIWLAWTGQPTTLVPAEHGWISWVLTLFGVGVGLWAVRNAIAVVSLTRRQTPAWQRYPIEIGRSEAPHTVLVTGATGFIGHHLVRALLHRGDKVIVFTRTPETADDLFGPHVEIVTTFDDIPASQPLDAVIALAGAPILGLPWTKARRKVLLDSRVETTKALNDFLLTRYQRPDVLLAASAIGFYGLHDDRVLTEADGPQDIFQSELCRAREAAADDAKTLGIRVCNLRFGVVLGADGGALPRLAMPHRFALGATLGNGRQYVSWIHIEDAVAAMLSLIEDKQAEGPFNLTTPEPVTNRDFNKMIGAVMRRPVWLRIPASPARLVMGQMAQILFDGQRVVPNRLARRGFTFKHLSLRSALEDLLLPAPAEEPGIVTAYFNGECPVCSREIAHYQREVVRRGGKLGFCDIDANPVVPAHLGVKRDELKRRLHAVNGDGEILVGVEAFIAIWRRMPRYRWLAALVSTPGIKTIARVTYDYLLVPLLWTLNKYVFNRQPQAGR